MGHWKILAPGRSAGVLYGTSGDYGSAEASMFTLPSNTRSVATCEIATAGVVATHGCWLHC